MNKHHYDAAHCGLPTYPGWAEAYEARAASLNEADSYFSSLSEENLRFLALARSRDIFAPCQEVSPFAGGGLRGYFLWKVDKFEGHIGWALERLNELGEVTPAE